MRRISPCELGPMVLLVLLLAALLSPPAGTAMEKSKQSAPQVIVILGASYAESWGTPSLPGYSVVNRGVGGEQTEVMRARFQRDVVADRPSAVLIWGHINNVTQSGIAASPPELAAAVKKAAQEDYLLMIEQANAAGIEVILATEIPLAESVGLVNQGRAMLGSLRGKQSYAEKVNVHVRDLNAFVRQLAASRGLLLLDFEKVFAPEGGARKSEYALDDRSHITPAGYRALTAYAVTEIGKRR